MAQFPCDVDGRRYPGPQRTMYPALVNGADAYRRKLRLCHTHFDAYHEDLRNSAANAQMAFGDGERSPCYICHRDADGADWALFVTVYDHGAEREDFWAPVHGSCHASAIDHWHL